MSNSRTHLLSAEPPIATEGQYEPLAARLQRQARQQAGIRPWRRAIRVILTENGDRTGKDGARLTAWVVADTAVNALWASSALGEFRLSAVAACPQVSRIIFTCPTDGRTGFAPRVVLKTRGRGSEDGGSLSAEFRDFGVSLHAAALESAPVRSGAPSNLDILLRISHSQAVQWEAIRQFLKHASALRYLECSIDEALRILDLSRTLMPGHPDGTGMLTRWKAIRMLAGKGWLDGYVGGQRPLRPHGTAATPAEVFGLVSAAFGRSMEDLAGPRRHAPLIHPRYFGAAVIRRATSRTLIEIGSILGGRDHATIIHGLDRIENWNETDPVHGRLLDTFVQLADNLGIMKSKEFRLMAASEIKDEQMAAHAPADVPEELIGGRRASVIPLSNVRSGRSYG